MKVKDLIKQLSELPQDYEVVMSKDGEGNDFSPCADAAGPYMYEPDSTWSGQVWSEEARAEDGEEFKPNAVVLWPTN